MTMYIKKEPEDLTLATNKHKMSNYTPENVSSNLKNNVSCILKDVQSFHSTRQNCQQIVAIKQETNDFHEELQYAENHFGNSTDLNLSKSSTEKYLFSSCDHAVNKNCLQGFKIKYEVDCQWPGTDENNFKTTELAGKQSDAIDNHYDVDIKNTVHVAAPVKCEAMSSNRQTEVRNHVSSVEKLNNVIKSQQKNEFNELTENKLSKQNYFDFAVDDHKIKREFINCSDKKIVINLQRFQFFDRNFVCQHCFVVFRTLKTLKRHRKNVHEAKRQAGKEFKCKICPYKGNYSHGLARHVLIHSGEKPFKCDLCSYATVRSHALTIHKRIHTKETPYKCSTCPYVSKQFNSLKVHLLIHNSEKKLHCDLCDFKCKQPSNLKSHKLTHSYEKKVECILCGKFYKTNNDLKRHQRIHSPEKPFKCDICGFGFKHSSNLKSHKLIHSKSTPFCCNLCEFKCKRSTHLSAHKKTIHFKELPIEYVNVETMAVRPYPIIDKISISVL